MSNKIFLDLYQNISSDSKKRMECIKKAFNILPKIDNPRILDVGCGKGGPTIQLAKLCNGKITGLDINQSYLDEFEKRIKSEGLTNKVKAINRSMLEMDFPDESFDIIWSEGSIFIIGFKRGLINWRIFIKPKGFLVVHEMCWLKPNPPVEIRKYWVRIYPRIKTIEENMKIIPTCGYKYIAHFPLPDEVWWEDYYNPLENKIQTLKDNYQNDSHIITRLKEKQKEIDLYKKYSKWYGSAYFIMQKS